MKFSDLIKMSMVQVKEMLKGMSTRRAAAFQKHGAPVPDQLTRLRASAGSLSDDDLSRAIGLQSSTLQGRGMDYSGYVKMQNERRNMLKERFGLNNLTDEQFDQYGQFMNAMQEREGARGWEYASALAKKIAIEAIRLNMDPSKFMRNFDYWTDHIDDLEKAKPLQRSRPVRASDYIKQLKLPTIKAWRNDQRGK